MSNINKVIKREYLTRVKKKSFIIMTLLAPLLIVGFYAAMIGIGIYTATEKSDLKTAILVNESPFIKQLPDTMDELVVSKHEANFDSAIAQLRAGEADAVIYVGKQGVFEDVELGYYTEGTSEGSQKSSFKDAVRTEIGEQRAAILSLNKEKLDSLKVNVLLTSKQVEKDGMKESNETVKGIIGLVFTFLIYFFIFIFAVQVMRGVMEEKTNRIVEVVISTVKPFELMFGKIVGIACVGLTQFLIWILLTGVLLVVGNIAIAASVLDFDMMNMAMDSTKGAPTEMMTQNPEVFAAIGTVISMPWPKIIFSFLALFIGGYLLYSSIFAAIGSAVDSETDTQQFMLPISLPLVLGIVIAQSAAFTNPHGTLAFWASMIPFTSPIVMTVRSCFDVPWWELLLSIAILYATFFVMVRFVAKIYRIGILTYGKKPSWKQLFKWVFSKN